MSGDGMGDIFDTVAAAEAAAVMEVRAPATGEVVRFAPVEGEVMGRPWTITLLGKDCNAFQALARAQQDRRIANQIRTRAAPLSNVIQKDDIDLLVVLTKTWDVGFPGLEKPSADNFRVAYTKYPALREQVDDFTGLRSNFIKS